jgi:hypothetical protein
MDGVLYGQEIEDLQPMRIHLIIIGHLAEQKRIFNESLSDCTDVYDDSNHYARALGAASPIHSQRSIRQGSLDCTRHLAGGNLRMGLASLSSNSVCGAPGCARSNLATEAAADFTRQHFRRTHRQ